MVGLVVSSLMARAQAPEAGTVEAFSGAELRYADTNYMRLYDVLINLTPGVKWHLGNDWLVTGQVFIPLVNSGYENKHNIIRLSNAAVA